MDVFHPLEQVPDSHRGGAVAIGNFDGVHLGHLALIDAAKAVTANPEVSGPAGVLTFEPHPRSLFRPGETAFRLTTVESKMAALARTGIAFTAIADFDREFADVDESRLSPCPPPARTPTATP